MKRPAFLDRLPGGGLREKLPSVWSPGDEDEPASPPPDETASPPPETDRPVEPATDTPVEPEVFDDAVEEDGTSRVRTALLGLSAFGAALAVGAAVARRLLGRGEDEPETEAVEDQEIDDEQPAEPLDEGTAAALGLAFLFVVKAIRDRLNGSTA